MDCLPHGFEDCTTCAPLYDEIATITHERDHEIALRIETVNDCTRLIQAADESTRETMALCLSHETVIDRVTRERDEALSGTSLRKAFAELSRVAEHNVRLESERDALRATLIARHGGEPIALLAELDEARRELDELKADLVFLNESRAEFFPGGDDSYIEFNRDAWKQDWETIRHDGTPAGLCASVRAARKGGE